MPTFPVVDAAGSSYECGRAHGAAVAGMVRSEVEARLGGQDRDAAFRHVAGVTAFVKRWAPHLLDEVRGIADGAGIDERAALWLQWGMAAPTEPEAVSTTPGLQAWPAPDPHPDPLPAREREEEGCTAFAVGPEFTGDGTLYAGQTKDTGPGANERSIVLRVRPAGRPAILSFSYAGHLAQIGISSTGVSLWGMSLYIDSPGGGGGPLLKRMLLESDSVAAMRELAGALSDGNGGAFGFSDAAGNVGVLERLPGRQIWLDGGRDSFGHANMIVSPDPGDRALDCYPTRCPSAGARHHRVNAALDERRGTFDVAAGFAILSDQTDHPKSICRETSEVDGILTNSAIVAEPLVGRLHVTYGPPTQAAPQTVSL